MDHALLCIRGVAALRIARHQLGEVGEGFPRGARVPAGHVGGQEAFEQAAAFGEGSQPLHVIGVIDIAMLRVQADKAICGGDGGVVLVVAVVGVDQLQLRLLGVAAEREVIFQGPQVLDRQVPLAGPQLPLCGFVEGLFGTAAGGQSLLGFIGAGAGDKNRGQYNQTQRFPGLHSASLYHYYSLPY